MAIIISALRPIPSIRLEDLFARQSEPPRDDGRPKFTLKRIKGFMAGPEFRAGPEFFDEDERGKLMLLNQYVGEEGAEVETRAIVIAHYLHETLASNAPLGDKVSSKDLTARYNRTCIWCDSIDLTARFRFNGRPNLYPVGSEIHITGTVSTNSNGLGETRPQHVFSPGRPQNQNPSLKRGSPFPHSMLINVRKRHPELEELLKQCL